jgi:hypothetical protein
MPASERPQLWTFGELLARTGFVTLLTTSCRRTLPRTGGAVDQETEGRRENPELAPRIDERRKAAQLPGGLRDQ